MVSTAQKLASVAQLDEGDIAPNFELPMDGDTVANLSEFKGKKNVVLYFYPKDDTPGCTQEAKDFRDLKAQFDKSDTVIIGLSKDDIKSHEKFKEKYSLPFGLASDAKGDVCEAYGAWGEKNMYGKKYMGIMRSTFLINKEGKIAKSWPKVKVEGHASEVLKAAQSLK